MMVQTPSAFAIHSGRRDLIWPIASFLLNEHEIRVIQPRSREVGMGEPSSRKFGPYHAFGLVAFISGASIVAVAIVCSVILSRFSFTSDATMFALAMMVAAPAFMGIGISFFIYRATASRPSKDLD